MGFLAGMVVPVFSYSFSIFDWVIILLSLCVSFYFVKRKAYFVILSLAGVLISSIHLNLKLANQLPEELENKPFSIQAKVVDLPKISELSASFYVLVEGVNKSNAEHLLSKKLRLSWRGGHIIYPGQTLNIHVKLKRPRGFANPNGFDYQLWLLQNKVYATGYVFKSDGKIKENGLGKNTLNRSMDATRFSIASYLDSLQLKHVGVIKALLLGDKNSISDDQWTQFNRTGTVHLMAISGLHVGLVAGLAFFFGRVIAPFFTGFSYFLIRFFPVITSVVFSSFYAFLAGFSVPTQRALIFVLLFSIAYLKNWRISIFHVILLTIVLVVLMDPLALMQQGFWLSFLAVLILSLSFANRLGKQSTIESLIYAQFGIFFCLAIPLAALGIYSSLLSPLVNLVMIPLFSFVIIPLLFISSILILVFEPIGKGLFQILDFLLIETMEGLRWASEFSFLLELKVYPNIPVIIFASVGAILILLPKILSMRILGFCFLLAAISLGFGKKENTFSLSVLDVGQGLSIAVTSESKNMVYDLGAKYSKNFDLGKMVVAPYLSTQGVEHIDMLVVSHGDNDHIGGFRSVANDFSIKKLVAQKLQKETASHSHIWEKCDGSRGQLGGFHYTFLWPNKSISNNYYNKNENNESCVLLIEYKGIKVLLLGDIEDDVEKILLRNGLIPPDIFLVVAAHHGSLTSSSASLVRHLNAKHVIFSSGYKNRYNHPHPKVVKRFEAVGARIWQTSVQGAISLEIDQSGKTRIWSYRDQTAKPWYD